MDQEQCNSDLYYIQVIGEPPSDLLYDVLDQCAVTQHHPVVAGHLLVHGPPVQELL